MLTLTRSPYYAHVHNALLNILRLEVPIGTPLPIHERLATRIGASRTTIHRILKALKKSRLLAVREGSLVLQRLPVKKDLLPEPAALSRRELVERSLINMLIERRLRPGDRFSELAMAREHHVTTVTIREALLRLARTGVVSKTARKQWTVIAIDAQMIDELVDLRVLLETFALSKYFQNPSSKREAFHRFRETMRKFEVSADPDSKGFFELDRELHRLILESSGNRYLVKEFQFVYLPMQIQFSSLDRDPERRAIAHSQHVAILDAIDAGEEKEALSLLRTHLEHSRQAFPYFAAMERAEPPGEGENLSSLQLGSP